MKATDEKKELEKHIAEAGQVNLEGDDKVAHDFFIERKRELIAARQNVLGVNIEAIWKAADIAYIPHQLNAGGKKTLVSNDDLGWRSSPVKLGTSSDWQEDSVPSDPYIKIQTAISILVDRNPKAVFKALAKKYEQASILHSELYKRSWEVARSKEQLKIMILNGAKYGIMAMQTAPLHIEREVRNPMTYEKKSQVFYDDVYRWALNPWTFWIDDMAKPGDPHSMNDWMRYRDYSWERFKSIYSEVDNFNHIKPKLQVASTEFEEPVKALTKKNVVRLWFYENLERDQFYIETDEGIPLVNEPILHLPKNKTLSIGVAPWTLRHQDSAYGIGLFEAMRNDYKLRIKIRNMTVDQLVLSIYREWFYTGTNALQGTGEMVVRPGVGRQVTSSKDIVWNNVPGPGVEAWKGLEWIDQQIDSDTGITKTLEGELSPGAKAFDIAQARESSLKRMRNPLDNISSVLETDARISVILFEEMYGIPKIEEIADINDIQKLQQEYATGSIPEGTKIESFDEDGKQGLMKKEFRTFPLNIERDTKGNILQIKEERFFSIFPEDLEWDGVIQVTGQSIIAESPLLEKQQKLEFSNMLIPLFLQPPELVVPAAKQLCKVYNEDPEDWFPISWMQFIQGGMQPQLFSQIPSAAGSGQSMSPGASNQMPQAQTAVPSTSISPATSPVQKFMNQANPLKSMGR